MTDKETLEELKSIISNKPVNSTHIEKLESGNTYYLIRCLINGVYGYKWYCTRRQSYIECHVITGELRSLYDIEEIIKLHGRFSEVEYYNKVLLNRIKNSGEHNG